MAGHGGSAQVGSTQMQSNVVRTVILVSAFYIVCWIERPTRGRDATVHVRLLRRWPLVFFWTTLSLMPNSYCSCRHDERAPGKLPPPTHAGFHFDSTVFYIVCWMPAFTYYLVVNLAANIAFNQSGYYAVSGTQILRPGNARGPQSHRSRSINQSISRFFKVA